uniref:Pherophorin domain-containing protein n=1 Tax=Chlamydomonas euryale TaxID=1486919 RepID=A0A7R9VZJ6_9CHLO|mmetsp:Transcript_8605/g.26130  ORF Transcript_8605/g.26130 Transcript_8605/m.26130 type:complete len:132 (+) Transcript_8605:258-653(+)
MARCAAPRARLHAAMGATLLLVAVLCTSGAQALNLVSSAEGTVNIANGGLTTFGLNDPARGGSPVFQPGDGRSAEVDFSTIPGPTLIVQLGQVRCHPPAAFGFGCRRGSHTVTCTCNQGCMVRPVPLPLIV